MRLVKRAGAYSVVFGEHQGSDGNEKSELEHAGNERAVDRANSPSVSPGANKHSDGIQANDGVHDTHENAHNGELRSFSEAVSITVFVHIDLVLQQILVKTTVTESDV